MVAENSADIGIYTTAPHGERLETFAYHSDRLVLCTPRGHPLAGKRKVAFAEALEYDFVGLHTGSAINVQLGRAASQEQRLFKLRIQVTSFDALCMMVSSGLGIGVLPETVGVRNAATLDIVLVALADTWSRREFRICVRSSEALPTAARLLVDHLRAGVPRAGGTPQPP